MKTDIDKIRRVHGSKYDAAAKEPVGDLPHNKLPEILLADNGRKARTCFLK
ncbi:hypothetical protein [Streptomyces sp. NPDC050355]|uniref:hypothetical protein n=1 Tax=Streptomyces sp. NPDC050355 TaxID=3365609 RepID=UPI0037912115